MEAFVRSVVSAIALGLALAIALRLALASVLASAWALAWASALTLRPRWGTGGGARSRQLANYMKNTFPCRCVFFRILL